MSRSAFLILFAFLPLTVALMQPADAPQTLVIGFYGDPTTSAAQGMTLALAQIAAEGSFIGADGENYQFEALISVDPAQLSDAFAVLALPLDEPPSPGPVAWGMPAFLLSSDAPLALRGVQATLFRGMTDRARLNDALIDFLVKQSTLRRVQLIGSSPRLTDMVGRFALAGGVEIQQKVDPLLTAADLDAVLRFNPQAIFYSGDLVSTLALLQTLSNKNWSGYFLPDDLPALLGAEGFSAPSTISFLDAAHWAADAQDDLSRAFTAAYLAEYKTLPDAYAVAAYDLTWALRLLVTREGGSRTKLLVALPTMDVIRTTGGQVNPARYGRAELYQTAVIYTATAPDEITVLARYEAGALTDRSSAAVAFATPTPIPTATPSQAIMTINSGVLSVRTGTGEEYQVLGDLVRGDQVVVIGRLANNRWYLVQSPYGPGWIPAGYGTLFDPGVDLPVLDPPPPITPTPTATLPSATPTLPLTPTFTATPDFSLTPVGTVDIVPNRAP